MFIFQVASYNYVVLLKLYIVMSVCTAVRSFILHYVLCIFCDGFLLTHFMYQWTVIKVLISYKNGAEIV